MSTREHGDNREETSDIDSNVGMGEKTPETTADSVDKKKRKRRPPLVPWKKPKDMPRRPLSAYNIFFKEQREALMAQVAADEKVASEAKEILSEAEVSKPRTRKRSNKSVGIGFANLARTIAANWKDMNDEARAPYESLAATEKARYKEEMLVWRAKQKKEKERALAAARQDVENRSSSPFPITVLDSSGETSMDDSHTGTGTVASAPPSFATPPSFHTTGARHDGPIHVGSSMDVDSPKRSRLTYQQHGEMLQHAGSLEYDVTPIRLSEMQARWSYDARSHSYPLTMDQRNRQSSTIHQNHPLHSSLSRLDALQATHNTMNGNGHSLPSFMHEPNLVPFPSFYPNPTEGADATTHNIDTYQFAQGCNANEAQLMRQEERRLMMQEQQMLQQQQQQQHHMVYQQQQYIQQQNEYYFRYDHPVRRNSWSGAPGTSQYVTKVPCRDRTESDFGRMMHPFLSPVTPMSSHISGTTSGIPESWFEPDTSNSMYSTSPAGQNDIAISQQHHATRGSKLYPDTWFEVGEAESPAVPENRPKDDEHMRYSPDGELNGKLPAPSFSGFHKYSTLTDVSLKSGSHQDFKMEQPQMQSLEDVAGGGKNSAFMVPLLPGGSVQVETSTKNSCSPEAFVESSSLQALGMQFDAETMDFLAKLRHESSDGNATTTGDCD